MTYEEAIKITDETIEANEEWLAEIDAKPAEKSTMDDLSRRGFILANLKYFQFVKTALDDAIRYQKVKDYVVKPYGDEHH